MQRGVVPIGQILAEKENTVSRQSLKQGRDEERDSPRRELSCADIILDQIKHQWHDELSGPTSEVAPPSGDPVGSSDNSSREQGAHPELGRDESGQREAGEKADQEEGDWRAGDGSAVNCWCGEKG